MNINKKKVLLFVRISTHFKEMIRVAKTLQSSNLYEPCILFDAEYEGCDKDQAVCTLEGIEYVCYYQFPVFLKAPSKKALYLKRAINFSFKILKKSKKVISEQAKGIWSFIKMMLNICGAFLLTILIKLKSRNTANLFILYYKYLWHRTPYLLPSISQVAYQYYQNIPPFLKNNQIQLMVFPEHNIFYFTQLLTYLGKQQGIPSIIVPFTIANTLEWSEAFYNDKGRSLELPYNKLFGFAFPKWIHTYKNKNLLLPIQLILLHEMFKISPKNPWLLNSGDIAFLALESEAMKKYYIKAGIEEHYLKATGALYNDELYSRLSNAPFYRKELCQSLGFSSEKPLIVCGLPPNQCSGREALLEFANFEKIIKFLLAELSTYAPQYNIVINLHPRINYEKIKFIDDYPVKIFFGDIAQIIPLSALYISSCSATIRMAVSCGVPVLNYDLYQYNYDDYTNLEGVITLNRKNEFTTTLKQLCVDKEFYEKTKAAQVKQSNAWGKLDGKAGQKLISEINHLFAEPVER